MPRKARYAGDATLLVGSTVDVLQRRRAAAEQRCTELRGENLQNGDALLPTSSYWLAVQGPEDRPDDPKSCHSSDASSEHVEKKGAAGFCSMLQPAGRTYTEELEQLGSKWKPELQTARGSGHGRNQSHRGGSGRPSKPGRHKRLRRRSRPRRRRSRSRSRSRRSRGSRSQVLSPSPVRRRRNVSRSPSLLARSRCRRSPSYSPYRASRQRLCNVSRGQSPATRRRPRRRSPSATEPLRSGSLHNRRRSSNAARCAGRGGRSFGLYSDALPAQSGSAHHGRRASRGFAGSRSREHDAPAGSHKHSGKRAGSCSRSHSVQCSTVKSSRPAVALRHLAEEDGSAGSWDGKPSMMPMVAMEIQIPSEMLS